MTAESAAPAPADGLREQKTSGHQSNATDGQTEQCADPEAKSGVGGQTSGLVARLHWAANYYAPLGPIVDLFREAAAAIASRPPPIVSGDERDAERFRFWFSPVAKSIDLIEYMRGVHEAWSLDQWRAYCDAAIAQTKELP